MSNYRFNDEGRPAKGQQVRVVNPECFLHGRIVTVMEAHDDRPCNGHRRPAVRVTRNGGTSFTTLRPEHLEPIPEQQNLFANDTDR